MSDAEARAQIEQLRRRVHPTTVLPCAKCGVAYDAEQGDVTISRNNIAGTSIRYGHCPTCRQHTGRLHRDAFHVVLGVDRDAIELDGLTVEMFADRPHARPDDSNPTRWAHLNRADLAAQVQERRDELNSLRGGPCYFCGSAYTPEGSRWHTVNRQRGPVRHHCGECSAMIDPAGDDDEVRGIVAAELLGLNTWNTTKLEVTLGKELAPAYWGETDSSDPNDEPWGHINRVTLYRRALASSYFRRKYGHRIQPLRLWLDQHTATGDPTTSVA